MPLPTASEGHYDQMLTDFSVGYQLNTDSFVAPRVAPVIDVDFSSGEYDIFPRGYFLQDQVRPRPAGGVPVEIGYRMQKGRYSLIEEGLRAKLDRRETTNWNRSTDPRENKVQLLTNQHLIHRERKWVNAFMRTGVWSLDKVGVAAAPTASQFLQLDQTNVDVADWFAGEMDNFAERTGMLPNTLIIGRTILRALRRNSIIRDAFKYTQGGSVTMDMLAGYLDIPNVYAPTVVHNNAVGEVINVATGLPVPREAYQFMFNKRQMLLCFVDSSAGMGSVTAMAQFAWTGLLGAGAFNSVVNRGTWDYGEWFDVLQAVQPFAVSPDLGVFYTDVVAA